MILVDFQEMRIEIEWDWIEKKNNNKEMAFSTGWFLMRKKSNA